MPRKSKKNTKMNNIAGDLANLSFDIKEKLTDKEYMELCKLAQKCQVQEDSNKMYEIVILVPTIHSHYSCGEPTAIKHFTIKVEPFTIKSRIVKCKENPNRSDHRCYGCKNNESCYSIRWKEWKKPFDLVDIDNLIDSCVDQYHFLKHLRDTFRSHIQSYPMHYEQDEETVYENRHINFHCQFTLLSLKVIENKE